MITGIGTPKSQKQKSSSHFRLHDFTMDCKCESERQVPGKWKFSIESMIWEFRKAKVPFLKREQPSRSTASRTSAPTSSALRARANRHYCFGCAGWKRRIRSRNQPVNRMPDVDEFVQCSPVSGVRHRG